MMVSGICLTARAATDADWSESAQSCLPLQASQWSLGALLLNDGPDLYAFDCILLLTPYQRLN